MHTAPGEYVDNVVRWQAFEATHPDIKIRCERNGVIWYASRNGVDFLSTCDLGRLLDRLESMTTGQPEREHE
jgi:hypothetical protein